VKRRNNLAVGNAHGIDGTIIIFALKGQNKSALQVVAPLQGSEDIRATNTVGVAHGYVVYAFQAKETIVFKPTSQFTP
jgi:hypothetical protein